MARTQARTDPQTADTAPPPAPTTPKKKRNGALTPAPSVSLDPPPSDDDWIWLSQWTADQWRYLIAYLWRVSPVVDLRTAGRPSNIRKYAKPFDIETIKHDEGSGTYRIDLCQISESGTGQKRIRQWYFTIMDMDYPPRVPLGEWIDDAQNSMWVWAKEPLAVQAAQRRQAAAVASGEADDQSPYSAADPNEIFNTVLSGIEKLRGADQGNGALVAAILQMVQSNQKVMLELMDPTKQLSTLETLMNRINPKSDAAQDRLWSLVTEELRATREELKALRAAPQKSVLEQLTDAVPVLSSLAETMGFRKGGPSRSSEWPSVIEKVVEKVGDAIPVIAEAIKAKTAASPFTLPPSTTPNPNPNPSKTQQDTAHPPDAHTTMNQLIQKFGMLINACAPFLVDHYQRQLTGYDFRDWFFDAHGRMNWAALKSEVGAQMLCDMAQQHQGLKVALHPPDRLLVFLNQFFTEPGQEQMPDSEPGDEEPQPQHPNA